MSVESEMTEYVSWSSNTGGLICGSEVWSHWHDCWHWWPPTVSYYSYPVTMKPNPFELSFKIVSKLLETKTVAKLTLEQFIQTVNEIAEIVKNA